MSGLEVEACDGVQVSLENVVTARLLEVQRHPHAERLVVCQVDAGRHGHHQIICGAPNARVGLVSCLALPGAEIADGKVVTATEIRGEPSNGMLCSARELGFGDDDSGLLELPDSTKVGDSLSVHVPTSDSVIELNLTPNRGDCLSLLGVAREIAAVESSRARDTPSLPVVAETSSAVAIELVATETCPRYVGRVIEGVNCAAVTPLWMRERLRRCGIRSISPVVDITNYVMLAIGQPMHAFDLDSLKGGIRVRAGCHGEKLQLLDGTTVELEDDMVVIADHAVPIALAGIMGGQATGVQKSTSRILFESAYFDPVRIARTARKTKLHTDAAHRFERGVDPTGQERAVELATKLLIDLCGGRPGPTLLTENRALVPQPEAIAFRLARANSLLGMEFSEPEARDIFERLNMSVIANRATWLVTPPAYRFDLKKEVDLVEELARLRGYTAIPTRDTSFVSHLEYVPRGRLDTSRLREQLVAAGYFEAVTYSFVSPAQWQVFSGPLKALGLANPISREMAIMRSSLWPGLLAALLHNQHRQVPSLRMFELGMVFQQTAQELRQINRIAGIAVGNVAPEQWGMATRKIDFFDLKQDILNLLSISGLTGVSFEPALLDGLHPGECALIRHGRRPVGSLGAIHPKVVNSLGLVGNPIVFELALEILTVPEPATYQPFSKFPSVRRDIALIVPQGITAGAITECVIRAGGALLKDLQLFDVYRGQGIDSDKKSLALGLIFQAPSSTLTDSQVQVAVSGIVDLLGRELGATLRI